MATKNRADRVGPSTRVTRSDILIAARRHYLNGETQALIAAEMGLSAGYLAKLLKQAVAKGWVRILVDTNREEELAADLLAAYPHLVHAIVVPDPPADLPEERRAEITATELGTAAALWLDDLLARDDEDASPQIWRIAVGGGAVTHRMIERLSTRPNRISVGPTALTPQMGKVSRFTAGDLAYQLAARFNALTAGEKHDDGSDRTGYLYSASVEPPEDALKALAAYYRQLETRRGYVELSDFWAQVDIAFVGVVTPEWRYSDVSRRLTRLGLSVDDLVQRGAKAVVANRFIDHDGLEVPVAPGAPSYEPVMPTEALRDVARRHGPQTPRRGFVVLDAWGKPGIAALPIIEHGLANVVLCDSSTANALHKRRTSP